MRWSATVARGRGPRGCGFSCLLTAFVLQGACTDPRPIATNDSAPPCYRCHGTVTNGNPAPPPVLWNKNAPPDAHQSHLRNNDWHQTIPCDTCHLVPTELGSKGHFDGERPEDAGVLRAELTFAGTALLDGAAPALDAGKCAGTYCHGTTLTMGGGAHTIPEWTVVDGSQAACGTCHALPPSAPHVQRSECSLCHGDVIDADRHFVNPELHIDGHVEVGTMACDACHGSDGNPAPPADTRGNSDTTFRGVGAHRQHLATSDWHNPVTCSDCHLVPAALGDAGHVDSPLPAELGWGALAQTNGAAPAFDGVRCDNTYCHGATLAGGGGDSTAPAWTQVDGTQAMCTSCHGNPPPDPHVQRDDCATCHGAVIDIDDHFIAPAKHIDGVVDVSGTFACNTCHGKRSEDPNIPQFWAPPDDASGRSSPSYRGVGAHQSHLKSSAWHKQVTCDECHVVPATLDAAGHADSARPAELTFGDLAKNGGADPQFDGVQCKNAYCHGAGFAAGGGRATEPVWTEVGGTEQQQCGTCHGLPPLGEHPALGDPTSCNPCHFFAGLTPDNPATHINGVLDGNFPCGSCHPVAPATGAHALHYGDHSAPPAATYGDLRVTPDYDVNGKPYYMFGCGNCHPVDEGFHMNGQTDVELYTPGVDSGSLKALNPTTAAYAGGGGTCANVYCHSTGQEIPSYIESPAWNGGGLASPRCSGCHDNPPQYASGGADSATANSHIMLSPGGDELGHFAGLPGYKYMGSYHGDPGAFASTVISCQTCHYESVDPTNTGPDGFYYLDTTGTYDLGGSNPYDCSWCHTGPTSTPPAKAGRAFSKAHVNGRRDVVFDPRTSLPSSVPLALPAGLTGRPSRPQWTSLYWSGASELPPGSGNDGNYWSAQLSGSGYNQATKTCTAIPCHIKQSNESSFPGARVVPLRWGSPPAGCGSDNCHQYL